MPANKYLCIAPIFEKKQQRVYLPFERDVGLLVILSKAFMLAEDDKIEDHSIIAQIERFSG